MNLRERIASEAGAAPVWPGVTSQNVSAAEHAQQAHAVLLRVRDACFACATDIEPEVGRLIEQYARNSKNWSI